MTLGNLKEAETIAEKLFKLSEERQYIHVKDIMLICYANLLQTEGRIMESLIYYERGLKKAKNIQKWDYLYGSIWRELAIAKFGDTSCFQALRKYGDMAKEAGFDYLTSLADCYYIISAYHLRKVELLKENNRYEEIVSIGMPGHILQSYACLMLMGIIKFDFNRIAELLNKCEGVIGSPMILSELLDYCKNNVYTLDKMEMELLQKWHDEYVKPILDIQTIEYEKRILGLSTSPVLSLSSCISCQAKCCYDGVYITKEEERAIDSFISEFPESFEDIKRPYIVYGDWPGMRSSRKTEKIEYNGYDNTFPKHFTQTRCVFALHTGECRLQRIATDNQLHPWKVKPRACWSFPIREIKGDNILPPPTDQKNDPDYVNESYPGYTTFLPCTIENKKNGQKWYEKYKYEIEYYKYLMRENLIQ